jgi:mycofactocin system glycosyltransferase
VPAGLRLAADPDTRFAAAGSVLVGGSPRRVLRLTLAGTRQVASWFGGMPVGQAAEARALARRLLDAGIAHPYFADSPGGDPAGGRTAGDATVARTVVGSTLAGSTLAGSTLAGSTLAGSTVAGITVADVTVVIPVRDRHAELARCLAGLRGLPNVVVVDDASADPAGIAGIAAEHGAAVIHRSRNGGPGAARNTGLQSVSTRLVAFLDSDCVPKPGWLDRLLPHFADPAVGAVAPRIVAHERGSGWLARYEGASSTLDMGAVPSIVRPGARVSYLPGAALVVRRAAAGDGFREAMHVGEDVDFVWRLGAAGWRIRYEPAAVMGHDHRVAFRAWFARRGDYGSSAAVLDRLHPGVARPLRVSWWTAGAWAAALAGRPVTAAALTATATALLARRLSVVTGERWPVPLPLSAERPAERDNSKKRLRSLLPESAAWRLAAQLAGGGTIATGRTLGSAISRTWWPAVIPAALAFRRFRGPAAALVLVPPLLEWAQLRPPLDPVRYVAARLLDDLGYSLGVWRGCLDRRSLRPLLPRIGASTDKRQPPGR